MIRGRAQRRTFEGNLKNLGEQFGEIKFISNSHGYNTGLQMTSKAEVLTLLTVIKGYLKIFEQKIKSWGKFIILNCS